MMHIQENISLKKLNSFGINVFAKRFAAFSNEADLEEILDANNEHTLILGGGSNILFTKNFDGLVLKNEIQGIEVVREDEHYIYVKAGAGVGWHTFVLYCIENNFAGAENLSLIPGSVGASPMQNIGAYGVELKNIFYELEAYHLHEKKSVVFSKDDCEFGYRESVFKNKYRDQFIITSVTFRLNKVPVYNTSYGAIEAELGKMGIQALSIKAISDAVISIRQSKLPDPKIIGNAGSFFKNPTIKNEQFEHLKIEFPLIVGYPVGNNETKLAAGWLIEKCGFKGYRLNDAGCHEKQALILVNYGSASGNEILEFSEKIIDSVQVMFNVTLQREVNIT
ncbi:MAG: UDP-N-acetylmuramate dehydrogenase [Ferruginibacter sp.]